MFTGKELGNIRDINICNKVSQVVKTESLVRSVGNREPQSAEHTFLFVAGFSLTIFYEKTFFFLYLCLWETLIYSFPFL